MILVAFIKGQDTLKYFRKRARALVKGKGRLLTFALVTGEDDPASGPAPFATPVILRAYYGALGEDGSAAVAHEEEFV